MYTKTALIAAIIFGTASVALASEHDANLANRYSGFSTTQSAPVAFQSRAVSLNAGQAVVMFDRASNPEGGNSR